MYDVGYSDLMTQPSGSASLTSNKHVDILNRWQKPGDKAKFKAIDNFESTPMSSRFVINENVLSGESISFGYETAGKWVRAMKAQGISFRLYMNDIFRISSFKEERGTDYPFSKSVSLSVGVRF